MHKFRKNFQNSLAGLERRSNRKSKNKISQKNKLKSKKEQVQNPKNLNKIHSRYFKDRKKPSQRNKKKM